MRAACYTTAMIVTASRRFQFSLRTLLIGVALFCIAGWWFANQFRIVQERDKMMSLPDCEIIIFGDGPGHYGSKGGIPWFRRWLGDREIQKLRMSQSTTDDEVERYRAAFPEADTSRR
jgi:hypothetical protein